MTISAKGTFEVKITPLESSIKDAEAKLGRMSLDKQFKGDLEATSKGEMLTAGTDMLDSAGYVALERVSGTLQGRRGTFVLQHTGIMSRGEGQLTVTVVPDSGTGELVGLTGTMTISFDEAGNHLYNFEYTLNETP